MPLQLWIVLAALAVASPSFAKNAAPKGAVHAWSDKQEPSVVPVGEPDLVPRSALSSDFPDIGTFDPSARPAPVVPVAVTPPPPAPAVAPAAVVELPASNEAPANAEAAAVDEAPPVAGKAPAVVEAPTDGKGAPVVEAPAIAKGAPAVVETPYGVRVPAVVEPPADAEAAEPQAPEEAFEPDEEVVPAVAPVPPPKPKPAPVVVKRTVPSGFAEKAAARAYLAQMSRPAPVVVGSSSPATGPGVLPPKIIEVGEPHAHAHAYGTPSRRTADRETLMREFPDQLVEELWLQDWQDLERAYQFGRLVDVPSDPDGRGIVLRLEGGSRIGELEDDAYKQTLLCRLAKPALGLLYRIAARMRTLEGPDYVPLEITSLVRTWDYQLRLTDVNPNADRTREGVPPTHVLGYAFDIARTQMSYERQQLLESLFDEMARDGELGYYKEGSNNGLMHYHVMALPSAETQLARYYERESRFHESQAVAGGERARMPEAPCVTFGSSLEPFSAICSCELPLEVSAQALDAGAPVSR